MGASIVAAPNGGMTKAKFRNLGAQPQQIAATAANFYGIEVENTQGFDAWVQLFDRATPDVGVDAPDKEFKVPGNSSVRINYTPQGVQFTTALHVASTTTEAGGQGSAKGVHVFVNFCPA